MLKRFAEKGSGEFFSPRAGPEEIQAASRDVGEELQGRYRSACNPANNKKHGFSRAVDLRCTVGEGRLRVGKGCPAPKQSLRNLFDPFRRRA